jgi:hypothetical protein
MYRMITTMVFGRRCGRYLITKLCCDFIVHRRHAIFNLLLSKVTYPEFDPLGVVFRFLSLVRLLLIASSSRITMGLCDAFEQT